MRFSKLGLVAVLFIAASSARAQLVVNGSFETGDFTGWTTNNLDAFSTVSTSGGPWVPEDGSFFFSMGNVGVDGTITQSITTNIGDTYDVTYWFGSDGSTPNDFTADFAGQTLFTAVDIAAQPYTFYSFDVTATSSSSLLEFDERDDPGYQALDNVVITDVTPPGTPEPGSIALLLGTGVFGSAFAFRRRKVRAKR